MASPWPGTRRASRRLRACPTRRSSPPPWRFTKGHGTENDFVLVRDLDGTLGLDAERVARLCDRRAGIGADGLIRVVRSAACPDAAPALAVDPGAEWFMDYRNADGSAAEMCGNGIRVFVAYLIREQLIDLALLDADGPGLPVASRAGVKRVRRREDGWFSVDMGGWLFVGGDDAVVAGYDATVHVHGLDVARPALRLDLGNPHTVAMLSDLDELAALDLPARPGSSRSRPRAPTSSCSWRSTPSRSARRWSAAWRCGCTSGAWGRPGPAAPVRARRRSRRAPGAVPVRRTCGGSTCRAARSRCAC